VIRRRKAYPIRLVEVPVEERPPIDPSLEEIRAIANRYPVLRVVYGAERAPRSGNGAAAGAIGTGETP
jgi:hypothetical protein